MGALTRVLRVLLDFPQKAWNTFPDLQQKGHPNFPCAKNLTMLTKTIFGVSFSFTRELHLDPCQNGKILETFFNPITLGGWPS